MGDLLPSGVRECGTSLHAHRLFDIVIEERETQAAESLRVRPVKGASNETLTVLRFHKPIGVLRAILKRIASLSRLLGTRQNAATPRSDSSEDMSESNSQLKSLILAQNERWRQA